MKNFIYIVPGGGIFSRLLQFAILPLADIEFDNVYLVPSGFSEPDDRTDEFGQRCYKICLENVAAMKKYGIEEPYEHLFNLVLDQKKDETYVHQGYLPIGTRYDKVTRIEDSAKFQKYQEIAKRLKLKQEIHDAVAKSVAANSITDKTLAVHVRLTSMNLLHHNLYEQISIDDYIRTIEREFAGGNYSNIFVASDNDESLIKLKQHFGNLLTFNLNYFRYQTEKINHFADSIVEYEWFYQKRLWVETFVETLGLSKCGALICRESNVTNAAIVYSDSFKKIVRVHGA